MKEDLYNDIMNTIRSFRGLSIDCERMLTEKYNSISPYTLNSILSAEVQRQMKICHGKLFRSNKNYLTNYHKAIKRGEPVGILIRIAKQLQAPPALLARHVLEKHYDIAKPNTPKAELKKQFKDTTLIEDKDLAYEVYLCTLFDDQYGPIADAIGRSVGQKYEALLQTYLTERNIAFHDEEHLRQKGYDKTPDVKLEVPIAVNGFVINWIESKARFGSADMHKKYIKDQFSSYWNRFGPGLVIYWFGFLDTLVQPNEKNFIIMDHFPENITYMNPSSMKPLQ
ncbi:uncharacterized protein C15orf41 homolog [Cephus cinctus]|uniref:CDAN1-interacting nuclease 1 n=1 Tax=Cephus cinctus TaxID=211228 RepID=A0AAJ7BPN6_CEPCN|nr:uncharacterized protein C15orf41 homolog [Cephus cinctus]